MREIVFTLDYRPGCNAVADALADHPGARIRSLSLHATAESLWRVDHATGSSDALAALKEAFLTGDYYADCLATDHCGATQNTQVLDHGTGTLVLYSYWERTSVCSSVPHIALDHLGGGVLFETRHDQRRYRWRLVHSGEGDVGAFFDELDDAVGSCADLEIERLSDTESPAVADDGGLPPEQETALRAAAEQGYYETPREIDVGELADRLDVARSTLAYRLRRAESHVVEQWLARRRQSTAGMST